MVKLLLIITHKFPILTEIKFEPFLLVGEITDSKEYLVFWAFDTPENRALISLVFGRTVKAVVEVGWEDD